MSKIFVTGATGLIGTRLTRRLVEEGHEVAGFTTSDHGKKKLENQEVKGYIGDIFNYEDVEAAIGDFQPEIIINELTDLKAVDMSANTRVRVEGTKNLVKAAQQHGVEHMQAQSIAFTYAPGEGLATEETPLDYNSEGDRKVTVDGVEGLETQTQEIPHHVILRYGYLYGPGTWFGEGGMIYNQFIDGEVTMSDGEPSFIHLDDAVETAIQALHFDSGIYNVADDEPVTGGKWAEWFADMLGVNPKMNIQPAADYERGVSNEKFKVQGGKLIYNTWREGMKEDN